MLCRADEVNYLSGPGKGVILIKLGAEDRVLGFMASTGDRDLLRVETSRGSEQTISTTKYEVTGRGGKGRELLQRGQFTRVVPAEVDTPAAAESPTHDSRRLAIETTYTGRDGGPSRAAETGLTPFRRSCTADHLASTFPGYLQPGARPDGH